MKPSPGIAAVRTLASLGYKFTLAGGTIRAKYYGPGKPDPDTVRALLEAVKAHKPDVLTYLSKPPPPSPPQTCEPCPWYELNPWSHDPALGAWCHRQMVHLVLGSAACEEFRRGEVPPRQTPERVPQVQPLTPPAPQEHVLTCFECPLHEHDTVNPTHGWGRCTLKKRGCYGLRPACSEIPRDTWDG